MSARILTAVGPDWEADLASTIESVPMVALARRCVDVADLLAAGAAFLGDTAMVSPDLRGLDRDALHHLAVHGVRVVGVTGPGDEEGERRLRQLGIAEVVRADASVADLESLFAGGTAASSDAGGTVMTADHTAWSVPLPGRDQGGGDPADRDRHADGTGREHHVGDVHGDGGQTGWETEEALGRVLTVWGSVGAPGRTTVAVSVAAELAATGRPTLLVDADTHGATVGQVLGLLDEAPGLAAACRASETGRLDLHVLAGHAPEVSPALRVLTGIPAPHRWPEVRVSSVEQILHLARRLAAHVVVDVAASIEDDEELSYDTLAPRRNAATLTALEHSDDLLVVGSGDPVGLQRLVRAVQDLGTVPSPRPRVLVNKVRSTAVGPAPEQRIGEVLGRFAGLDRLLFVPFEPATVDGALLHGRTLVEHAPSSTVRGALRDVAATYGPTAGTRPRGRRARRRRRASATMSP